MTITFKVIMGWILIFLGLGVIFWDISTSYYYFTGQKQFPQIFAEPKIEGSSSAGSQEFNPQELASNIIKEQLSGIMPANSVSELLNLTSWIVFASFLIYAGGKVTGVGIDLIKKEVNI